MTAVMHEWLIGSLIADQMQTECELNRFSRRRSRSKRSIRRTSPVIIRSHTTTKLPRLICV